MNYLHIYAWDYIELLKTYSKAADLARRNHVPCIIYVKNLLSHMVIILISHERYKSKERLQWEKDNCCIKKMKEWIIENDIILILRFLRLILNERSAIESKK